MLDATACASDPAGIGNVAREALQLEVTTPFLLRHIVD
jgi:hypothetical protein